MAKEETGRVLREGAVTHDSSPRQTIGGYFKAFHEGLSKLGWTEGQDIVVTPY